jgi:5-(carboxyamino)imidazole ribonucleotide synthase
MSSSLPRPALGVIGGGQLAWMLGQAAQSMGYDFWVQTPNMTDPAVGIATGTIIAPIADSTATSKLAQHCAVITFENEFVDLPKLQHLAQQGVQFAPRLDHLSPLLDKYDQRCYLQKIGLPTPPFCVLKRLESGVLENPFGFPVVLKARRQGYDGYGTTILENLEALENAVSPHQPEDFLLEEFVPFERELAVMVARSFKGEISLYPVVETQQKNQVCHRVIAPAPIDISLQQEVQEMAQKFIEILGGVGIFGLEFFLTSDHRLLVNEIAPRTHNSGHFSLDACLTSQFEQQLRAIFNLPLGAPDLKYKSAVMINLLGYESSCDHYHHQQNGLRQIPQSFLYWYGKTEARPGRKMGHLTLVFDVPSHQLDLEHIDQFVSRHWSPLA